MLFYLFCMFDDYGGINHRSPESAGKSVVKTPYLRSSFFEDNHRQFPIIPDDGGSQKGGPRWCLWGPHHLAARMAPWRASRWCRGPGPPGSAPFRALLPPVTLRRNTSSTKSSAASTGRKLAREKSSPVGSNLSGKFLPGGGRSKPSSPSSSWTSLGSSSQSSPSPSPPLHFVPL